GKTKTGQVDPSKKRVLRDWTYFELQRYVKEKAKGEGIKVLLTPPHYTSQTCSNCSHTSKENRITQAEFLCEKCGMEMNADRNAAINISRSK
ncbi:MAG: transposase, partial [Proteobacteria bacterium]|nr:transposase [Pseudomonadota bacterium]